MDPKECLLMVGQYLTSGQLPDALEGLENYADWRNKGGYEPGGQKGSDFPINGDEHARMLRDALIGAIRKSLKLPRKTKKGKS